MDEQHPQVEDELPDLSDVFDIDEVPEEQIEDAVSNEELEALFKQKEIDTSELKTFWDEAIDSHQTADVDSDKLTYEQAKQLGLTPDDGA
jgi:rhodanese-related sulfurtransferase